MFIPNNGDECPKMFNTLDIQRAYVDLYRSMRRYIWGFDVVEALASLEIAAYQTCPDLDNLHSKYNQLEYLVRPIASDDEDLRKDLDNFNEVINSGDTTYAVLRQVNEVV